MLSIHVLLQSFGSCMLHTVPYLLHTKCAMLVYQCLMFYVLLCSQSFLPSPSFKHMLATEPQFQINCIKQNKLFVCCDNFASSSSDISGNGMYKSQVVFFLIDLSDIECFIHNIPDAYCIFTDSKSTAHFLSFFSVKASKGSNKSTI